MIKFTCESFYWISASLQVIRGKFICNYIKFL